MPPPFDNTYNSPEHDAFVLKVKYQRNDAFFTNNIVDGADRARLEQAWNDLFGSWPYHDAYLGMLADHYELTLESSTIAGHDAGADRGAAGGGAAARQALRAHYDAVVRAQTLAAARSRRRRADVCQPRLAAAAHGDGKASLRAFYQKARAVNSSITTAAIRALVARILVSPEFLYRVETGRAGPGEAAERLGNGQPHELFPLVVDSRRRAAPRRRGGRAEQPGAAGEAGQAHDRRPEGAPPRHGVLRPVARLLSLRRVPRRRHRTLPRVHRRGQDLDVRRGDLDLRVHRPGGSAGQRDPLRRLHVPQPAAREVLRHRRPTSHRPARSKGRRRATRSTAAARCASARC